MKVSSATSLDRPGSSLSPVCLSSHHHCQALLITRSTSVATGRICALAAYTLVSGWTRHFSRILYRIFQFWFSSAHQKITTITKSIFRNNKRCRLIERSNKWLLCDTIRDAILTCARKPTWVSLIYRTKPTTKKCKNRKKTKSRKQICPEITVNSPGIHVVNI